MSEETNTLLKQMMEQMNKLQEQVNTLQSKQSTNTAPGTGMETDEVEQEEGGLVEVSEATQAFLGAAFSGIMDNDDRRKRIKRIGVPDCDQIRCPKLDGVMKAVLPTDAIKADGYLSRLQQFWLDAVAPLAAILESAEAGELTPEKAVASTQAALCLMGNAHQQMAQERRKKLLLKLNPSLKFMAEDRKNFESAAPMLFGEEFAKSATTRVDQVKAMKKISKPEDRKGSFSGYHPRSYQTGRGGGYRSGRGRFQPYSKGFSQSTQSSSRPAASNQGQKP